MPAGSKTFQTLFNIAAKYTGKPAFAAANRDINRTERNAKSASRSINRMFGAVKIGLAGFAGYVGYKAFREVFEIGGKAFDAAKEVRKAHDIVRLANERLVKQGRLRSQDLEKQTQETIALAEAMQKAGGIDAETLQVSFAELSKAMSSEQIEKFSKGYQDWMVTVNKGAPTLEQSIENAQKIVAFIQKGRARSLEGLNLTKEQIKYLSKLNSVEARAAAITKIVGRETAATATWKKTDAGVTYDLAQAQEDWLETMGEPLAAAQRDMNIALTELYKELLPVAKLIANEMSPRLKDLARWIGENKERIVEWGLTTVSWVTKIWDSLAWLQSKSEEFFKPIWANTLKEFEWLKSQLTSLLQWLDEHFFKGVIALIENVKNKWKDFKTELYGTSVPPTNEAAQFSGGMGAAMKAEEEAIRGSKAAARDISPALPSEPGEPQPLVPEDVIPLKGTGYPPYQSGSTATDFDSVMRKQISESKAYTYGQKHRLTPPGGIPEPAESVPFAPGSFPTDAPVGGPPGSSLKHLIKGINMRQRTEGASGGTNVAMNPVINIHGVPAGREGAVGREVQRALRDPTRDLLTQIKAARAHETRLGYI